MSSKNYFEEIGAGWDRLRQSFFTERVRDRALEAAGVSPGHLAADVGAGTGFITEALVARGVRVIAVDQSGAMLDALIAKFPGTEAVDCRPGEAECLPIDDATVDLCFANMFLHHVERPGNAIREMARILKPAGKLVVTDLDSHAHGFLRDEHHDRWMGFARDEVREWFREAGLLRVEVDGLGEACCSTSAAGERASIGIFMARGEKPS